MLSPPHVSVTFPLLWFTNLITRMLVDIITWQIPPATNTFPLLALNAGHWWSNFAVNLAIFPWPLYNKKCVQFLSPIFLSKFVSSPFLNFLQPLSPLFHFILLLLRVLLTQCAVYPSVGREVVFQIDKSISNFWRKVLNFLPPCISPSIHIFSFLSTSHMCVLYI